MPWCKFYKTFAAKTQKRRKTRPRPTKDELRLAVGASTKGGNIIYPQTMKPNGLKHLIQCAARTAGSQRSPASSDFRRPTRVQPLRHFQSIFSIRRPSQASSIEAVSRNGRCIGTGRQKSEQNGFCIVSSRPSFWKVAISQQHGRAMASEPSAKKDLHHRFRLWTDSEGP